MASTALEEKINKIRLQNEEIKRRYEEVEADKKNAAKLDALVEPLPAEDWPERKEPPEFSAPAPKHVNKNANKHSLRKHTEQTTQYYTGSGEGKKSRNFADGQGPPPDPKYNFLADSEREEHGEEAPRDTERNKGRSKPTRGVFKRRGSGRDWHAKEHWNQQGSPVDATRPDYEAWRAERNRIDEARISRQRTAEGNWRREWDNDKVHLADEATKRDSRVALGDVITRQEHMSDNEKLYRSPRTAPRNSQHPNARDSYHGSAVSEANKAHGSVNDSEKRVVIATDRSIKVVLNPGSTPPKSSVMSVKVSPPNIAGTGRVGPRQRPRVMYSSQMDADASSHEAPTFTRQKSADEKSKPRPFDQPQKAATPKSPYPQRKRDVDPKSPYLQRKDNDRGEKYEGTSKSGKKDAQKSPYPQRRGNAPNNYPPKSPRGHRRSTEAAKNDFAKMPRAQQERNREKFNAISNPKDSKSGGGDANASAASAAEKPNELPRRVDSADEKNKSVPIKQFQSDEAAGSVNPAVVSDNNCTSNDSRKNSENNSANETMKQSLESANSEILESDKNLISDTITKNDDKPSKNNLLESAASPVAAIPRSTENNSAIDAAKPSLTEKLISANETDAESRETSVTDHDKTNDDALLDSLPESTNPAAGLAPPAENDTVSGSKEILGEASGSRDPKDTSSDDIAAGSTTNQEAINCSASSGLASNDSGFIDFPSNDSIHDVTNNGNAETSDFAETSVDSVASENEIVENRHTVENLEAEPKVAEPVENAAGSSSETEKIAESSSANVLEDRKVSHDDASNIALPQETVEGKVETTGTPDGSENNSRNATNDTTESEGLEKDSTTSSNVNQETESNANVVENDSVQIKSTKLESQVKNIANSAAGGETGSTSNNLKSEEKNAEKTENAAEASKNSEELQNKSNKESASENSIIDDELEDGSINESASVSKGPNDSNKEKSAEPAIVETSSLPAIDKN